jgi:hypothetical protein
MCLELTFTSCPSCFRGLALSRAPSRQRGSGARSHHCFVINSAMFSYPSSPISLTGDNLVSRGSDSTSAVMSPQSGIGSGSTIDDMLNAILQRLTPC